MAKTRNSLMAEPMLTPLCDAAMTLIVIFIMTLPAVMWSGFNVDATRAEQKPQAVQVEKTEPQYAAVSITERGFFFNGIQTSEKGLYDSIKKWAESLKDTAQDKMVIILPDDNVMIDSVVRVFDIARLAGAEKFALLEPLKPEKKKG